ncbi:MAG: 16S rRNA (cytidine(1402)-2'-O)-methyltransferase [Dehalococcoidia bacterium]|nr:MAG: 16S rRNA (cytidine(1402)-2'-O)-methyltransferase [Dehalococcoidia bacterium]
MAAVLYIVATPIGNLKDLTLRAIETLKSVDVIACEDTRHTKILLNAYDIQTSLISYFEHNKIKRAKEIIQMLHSGKRVALVSDAGTPGISDPGYRLVHDAIASGVGVVAIPGASAAITALAVSGLATDRFSFEGFLPPKTQARRKKLKALSKEERTIILYESPHRIARSLYDIEDVLGDIFIVCARELTKKFEEIRRERVSVLLKHFTVEKPQGEFVLLFDLRSQKRISA